MVSEMDSSDDISKQKSLNKQDHENKWLRRLLYLVFLLCVTGGFAFHMQKQFVKYLKDPTIGIRVKNNETAPFPDVTVCFPSYFLLVSDYLYKAVPGSSIKCKANVFEQNLAMIWRLTLFNTTDERALSPLERNIHVTPAKLSMLPLMSASDCGIASYDVFSYCRYESKYCDFRNFTTFYDGKHGPCFQFTPTEKDINFQSPEYGLILGMTSDYVKFDTNQIYDAYQVFLHPRNTWPNTERVDATVMKERHVFASFQYQYLEMKNKPKSPCIEEQRKVNLCRLESRKGLVCRDFIETKSTQKMFAQQLKLYKACGCVSYEWPIPVELRNQLSCHHISEDAMVYLKKGSDLITTSSVIKSLNKTLSELVNFDELRARHTCYNKVIRLLSTTILQQDSEPCLSQYYDAATRDYESYFVALTDQKIKTALGKLQNIEVAKIQKLLINKTTNSRFTDEMLSRMFKKDESAYNELTRRSARLVVYAKQFGYDMRVEFYVYEFLHFLADIGGVTGLWIGMSVVTIFEVVEWLVKRISQACRQRRMQRM